MSTLKFRRLTLDMGVRAALAIAAVLAVTLVVWFLRPTTFTITNEQSVRYGPLTGTTCQDPTRRPIAVMLASDPQARPLSGLAEADMVFEMPVTPDGITRMMAVFQCNTPTEIGSIRSARQDFIPLAQGLGSILAHWGGERDALEHLNNHVIDNVDALVYEGTAFYRKKDIPRPHNGFSTLDLIRETAAKLGYASSTSMTGYPHEGDRPAVNIAGLADRITIPWPQEMDVRWQYDQAAGTYARWRDGTPETDATTGVQVHVSVVIVMDTDQSFLRDQYISVRTLGQGTATVYQDGRKITALWKKTGPGDMLLFTDDRGNPILLAPGKIWVEIQP